MPQKYLALTPAPFVCLLSDMQMIQLKERADNIPSLVPGTHASGNLDVLRSYLQGWLRDELIISSSKPQFGAKGVNGIFTLQHLLHYPRYKIT
jgi:hypothetical protein